MLHEDRVFLRREAIALGYNDRSLRIALRSGQIARVRQGAYTSNDVWQAADRLERHRIASHAVLRSHGHTVALSHTSAAVDHDLRLWEPDLSRVHVTRLDGGPGRTMGDVVYHEGAWTPDDLVEQGDHLLTAPPRAAVETASLMSVEGGLVVVDSALDLDLATEDELSSVYKRMGHWPKFQHLQITMRLARPGAASVGETRARYLCRCQNLPMPELQFKVHDAFGNLIGITDFAWPEQRLLGEFDGKIKYGRLLKPGEEAGDVVFREKVREDRLREATGWMMIRLIWGDLYVPVATARRIRSRMTTRSIVA